MRKARTDLDRYMSMLIFCDSQDGLGITAIKEIIARPHPETEGYVKFAKEKGWIEESEKNGRKRYKTTEKGRGWCLQYLNVAKELGTLRVAWYLLPAIEKWEKIWERRMEQKTSLMTCAVVSRLWEEL